MKNSLDALATFLLVFPSHLLPLTPISLDIPAAPTTTEPPNIWADFLFKLLSSWLLNCDAFHNIHHTLHHINAVVKLKMAVYSKKMCPAQLHAVYSARNGHFNMRIPLGNARKATQLGEQIEQIQTEIDRLLHIGSERVTPENVSGLVVPSKKKRTMSPAAKKKIIAAQKARWAKYHAEKAKA